MLIAVLSRPCIARLLKYQAVMERAPLPVRSINRYRQGSSVERHDSMDLLNNLLIPFPSVVECTPSNLGYSRGIFQALTIRHKNFPPVRPGHPCLQRLTICATRSRLRAPSGVNISMKLLNGGPGSNFDLARFSFQVPVNGVMC